MPTTNFAFPDQLTDWTVTDVNRLDSVIASMLQHTHDGTADEFEDVEDPPVLTYDDSEGALTPGTVYYYRVSLVDEHGRETMPSDIAEIELEPQIETPGAPTASILESPGSLPSGTYLYAYSAWTNDPSQETEPGTAASVVVSPQHAPAQISLVEPERPDGADGWNVYRLRPGGLDYVLLMSVSYTEPEALPSTLVDTGLIAENPNQVPSRVNATNMVNSVDVEYPGGTIPAGLTWNVFRTSIPGYWVNSLIWRVVEETSEGSGIVSPVFRDTGFPSRGSGPATSQSVAPNPPKILLTAGAHVSGLLPASMIDGDVGGSEVLNDLDDVDTSGASHGESLTYDSYLDMWVPGPGGGGGGSDVEVLNDLDDVNTSGSSNGDVLTFDSGTWVPSEGTPGPPGLDGMSAYEVAVDEGFVGTEGDWLDSLVGPQGDPGTPGTTTIGSRIMSSSGNLLDTDAGIVVEVNSGSTLDVTIVDESSGGYDPGGVFEIYRLQSDEVNIVPDAGVLLFGPGNISSMDDGVRITEINGSATLRYRGSDTWVVGGLVEEL